jgi:hypothetical protein
MTRSEWKRDLLGALAAVLEKDDDFCPDHVDPDSKDCERWGKARDELVEEFRRRAADKG